MEEVLQHTINYLVSIDLYEATGLIFGLLSVIFLIKNNIWTWPTGIIYVLVSLVVFWQAKLYADLALHIGFLVLNIYGWWYWIIGQKRKQGDQPPDSTQDDVPVSTIKMSSLLKLTLLSVTGIFITGFLLSRYTDASLPYWDSAITILSVTGIWLTARKKIENWYFWFVVDVLATGVYFYKDIHFYAILYLIYIGLAISGYLEWRKIMRIQAAA